MNKKNQLMLCLLIVYSIGILCWLPFGKDYAYIFAWSFPAGMFSYGLMLAIINEDERKKKPEVMTKHEIN